MSGGAPVSASFLIEIHTDIDVYFFSTSAGNWNVNLVAAPFSSAVHTIGNSLDIGLALLSEGENTARTDLATLT